jgi:hypothetical protein
MGLAFGAPLSSVTFTLPTEDLTPIEELVDMQEINSGACCAT